MALFDSFNIFNYCTNYLKNIYLEVDLKTVALITHNLRYKHEYVKWRYENNPRKELKILT